jgi:chromosome segregation ATPase
MSEVDTTAINELRQRVAALEAQLKVLSAQIRYVDERTRPKPTRRELERAMEQSQAEQLERDIGEALEEAYEFTPDHGYGQTPDEILAMLTSMGVEIPGNLLVQKRAIAAVLKGIPYVKAGRSAEGRVYLGMMRRHRETTVLG